MATTTTTIKLVPFPGSVGSTGPAGPQGAQGPTGDPGQDALWNYQGEYVVSGSYVLGDIVTYAGSLWYMSANTSTGNVPVEGSAYWDLLAARGGDGEGVPPGGSSGFYLVKDSNTDYDVTWGDPSIIAARKVTETFSSLSGATGVVTHDCSNAHIFNHTTPAANFTVNLTNLDLDAGSATTVTLIINQGSSARIPNALQIAGVAKTINWQGGTVPTGYANKKDIVSFSIINNGGSYAVFGQLVSFG